MKQSEMEVNTCSHDVAGAKRGKTRSGKSRLVSVLRLIGRESCERALSQPQSVEDDTRFSNVVKVIVPLHFDGLADTLAKECF